MWFPSQGLPGEIGFPGKPGHPGPTVSVPECPFPPLFPVLHWSMLGVAGPFQLATRAAGHSPCPFSSGSGDRDPGAQPDPFFLWCLPRTPSPGIVPHRAPARMQIGAPSLQATTSGLLTQMQIQKPLLFKVWLLVPTGHVQRATEVTEGAELFLFLSSLCFLTPELRRSWGSGAFSCLLSPEAGAQPPSCLHVLNGCAIKAGVSPSSGPALCRARWWDGLCSGDHSHPCRPADDTEGGLSPLEGITLQLAFSPEGQWMGKPGDPIALKGIQTAEKR